MNWLKLSFVFILVAPLSGCALTLLDWVTPTSGYKITSDIAYGPLPRQRYDLYQPDEPLIDSPTIFFFYGGSWQEGEKSDYRFVAQAFAKKGYTVVIPNYRVYPDAVFPNFIEDCANAVKYYLTQFADKNIVLVGHSAGAHIASMLAFNNHYLQSVDVDPSLITAFVGWSGPYDFLPIKSETLKVIFGGADDIPETQPINFVNANSPPTLLIHGDDDESVYPKNSKNLAAKLRQFNVSVEEIYYPSTGHAFTVGAVAAPLRRFAPTLKDTVNFLQKL